MFYSLRCLDYVGQFLPWHRYYVRAHEIALQQLCNYTGAHPYWDELSDYYTADVTKASVFDPDTGFGGNGTGSDGCVADGPFANISFHMSNSYQRGDSFCLKRDLSESSLSNMNKTNIETCFGYENYTDAWYAPMDLAPCTEKHS